MKPYKMMFFLFILLIALAISGCTAEPSENGGEQPGEQTAVAENDMNDAQTLPVFTVVASFYPYADIASNIGGEYVAVHQLVPDGVDPHSFEPSPRDLIQLLEAQAFLFNGLELEPWLESALDMLAGTEIRMIKGADLVDLLPIDDDHDHDDEEDDHETGDWDPHIWTDPVNMKQIAAETALQFAAIDPDHAAIYEENYQTYASALDELDTAFREMIQQADQRVILVSHAAFGYMADRYGLRQIAVSGIVPHSEPNPGRLAELTNIAGEYELDTIFFESIANPGTAEVLAREANLETRMLHNMEGLTAEQREAGEDYLSLMYENLATLMETLVK